jgi:hypothetical protein
MQTSIAGGTIFERTDDYDEHRLAAGGLEYRVVDARGCGAWPDRSAYAHKGRL